MATKKKSMSRDEVAELYRDLQANMALLKSKKGASKPSGTSSVAAQIAASIKQAMARDDNRPSAASRPSALGESLGDTPSQGGDVAGPAGRPDRGAYAAVMLVLFFAVTKVALSALDASGVATATPAQASIVQPSNAGLFKDFHERAPNGEIAREELAILTALDARRAELEERRKSLEERANELDRRDREFVTRLTELRELNERLKAERERDDKRRSAQLDQLANVYGSMNPPEAAQLLQQLDITIALALVERMPEKRIGQILSLMERERALMLTKMLSGRGTYSR